MSNSKHITVDLLKQYSDGSTANNDARFARKATTAAGYGITDVYTKDEIDAQHASAYKAKGTKAAAELTSELLIAGNEGSVYNLSDALTITNSNKALFVENAEGTYPKGSNVVVVEGTAAHFAATEDTTAQAGKTYYADANGTALASQPTEGASITGEGYYELVPASYKFDVLPGFVDLSNYATKSETEVASAEDIAAIVNGQYQSA